MMKSSDPANYPVAPSGRRRFLIGAIVGGGAGATWLSLGRLPQANWESVGQIPPDDGWYLASDGQVWLVRNRRYGLAALEAICPHQACPLVRRDDDIFCGCHGSRFDSSGARLEGPTHRGLSWFPVRVAERQAQINRWRPSHTPVWTELG